jgi:glycosyltransferase involved in cell wall biosynthesis
MNEYCTTIKTMEYIAMGKPVVAFDLAETRFSAQDDALYATPNVVEDFADKIEILLDNEELRLKLGAFGRKRIEEELNWDHSVKNLLLAYESLFPTDLGPRASDPAVHLVTCD